MTEPIELPFGMLTQADPRNLALDGVQIRPWKGMHRHAWRYCVVGCAKIAEPIDAGWVVGSCGLKEPCTRWGSRLSMRRSNICGKGHARRYCAMSCAKWLNRSRCHLGCGLGWAEGSMRYMGHIGAI